MTADEEVPMRRHTVGDVMTSPAISVPETATYHEIVDTMVAHHISAVPVVNANGYVVGVVSEADLLPKMEFAGREPVHRLFQRKRVRDSHRKAGAVLAVDLMSGPAVVIRPAASIAAAAALMGEHQVKRLPVVDAADNLIGIVSRADLVRLYARPDDEILSEIRDHVLSRLLSIDPDLLSITVTQGVVSIGGAVGRRSTVSVVELVIQAVPGVVHVANHLSYRFDDEQHPIVLPVP
jgi:CBS domain-containing protein